jgi:hypothetical protein
MSIQVTYSTLYQEDQQSACFYTDHLDVQWIATIEKDDKCVEVWRVGEMRLWLPDDDGGTLIRYSDQLVENGITTDDELEMAGRGANPLDWQNNPWFELYDPMAQEWLSVVTHDVYDAVYQAGQLLISNDLPPYK